MSEKCSTFVGEMRISIAHIFSRACRMVCVLGVLCAVVCGLSACGWKEAKEVIALADSLDQAEHVHSFILFFKIFLLTLHTNCICCWTVHLLF